MWNYFIGPVLAFLPRAWRRALPFADNVNWRTATLVSGIEEGVGSLIGIGYWYMHAMTAWVDRGVAAGLNGKISGATVQDIAGVTWAVWVTHPLTLFLGYCMLEGAVRFCGAAFGDDTLGCFPLFLIDRVLIRPFRPRKARNAMSPESTLGNARSIPRSLAGAVRERVLAARAGEMEDELCFRKEGGEEVLEICACRRKQDWIPPRVVRFEDHYYRLETASSKKGARPFSYTLRRLAAGVPGRNVLLYSPAGALVRN